MIFIEEIVFTSLHALGHLEPLYILFNLRNGESSPLNGCESCILSTNEKYNIKNIITEFVIYDVNFILHLGIKYLPYI